MERALRQAVSAVLPHRLENVMSGQRHKGANRGEQRPTYRALSVVPIEALYGVVPPLSGRCPGRCPAPESCPSSLILHRQHRRLDRSWQQEPRASACRATESTAAIRHPSGSITTYRRFNKPPLGRSATAWTTSSDPRCPPLPATGRHPIRQAEPRECHPLASISFTPCRLAGW